MSDGRYIHKHSNTGIDAIPLRTSLLKPVRYFVAADRALAGCDDLLFLSFTRTRRGSCVHGSSICSPNMDPKGSLDVILPPTLDREL